MWLAKRYVVSEALRAVTKNGAASEDKEKQNV